VTRVADLNALSLIRPRKVLMTKDALELIKSQSSGSTAAA
jgi:hypothetical protein